MNAACEDLNQGYGVAYTLNDASTAVTEYPSLGLTEADAGVIVGTSIIDACSQYIPAMQTFFDVPSWGDRRIRCTVRCW